MFATSRNRIESANAHLKEYYGVKLNGNVVGITTAYCINPNGALLCPSWVDLAIGKNKPKAINGAEGEATTSTSWPYEPMEIGEVVP